MGDRANIFVINDASRKAGVFLYTHWGGSNLPSLLQSALKRAGDRVSDDQYLTRIIFCEMLMDQGEGALEGHLGLGISSIIGDDGYRILVVDPSNEQVHVSDHRDVPWVWTLSMTINEYCELDLADEWASLLPGIYGKGYEE